ncbi:MAG: hypothetical protein E7487_10460 [Ruminococcaceae bacterium]|nr:hypothetical protein [Oscillospiraceae bacterium]
MEEKILPNRGYKVMDVHTHIFPQSIAQKATLSTGNFYGVEMRCVGEVERLIEEARGAGIFKALVFSAATVPKQVEHINDYICNSCGGYEEFIGFGTLHPYMDNIEREVVRCQEMGLRGFKFHPDMQEFYLDEAKAVEMFRIIAKYQMPVLLHMGDDRYTYSAPERLRNVTDRVPELISIAAHFGGYQCWPQAVTNLKDGNIYFDTSSSFAFIEDETAVDLIHYFGYQRFMFGSDFPMWSPAKELEHFLDLELNEDERERILHGTFEEVIGE